MKRNLLKIVSILCLVGVLVCAFVPCITLTGGYMEMLNGITGAAAGIPDESYEVMEQMLEAQGVTIDLKASMDALTNLAVPLSDGKVSILDFYELSENAKEVSTQLGGLPIDGFSILGEESNPAVQVMSAINEMVITLAEVGQIMGLVSSVFLIPVGLFALLAFFVVLRIILRIFGRRGLGIGVTILAILNAVCMVGISYGVNYAASEDIPLSAEYTMVPFIMVACALVNCIIWVIGRGAKVKKVKEVASAEETPVVPITPVVPVAEPAVALEEVVVEEAVEDTSATEDDGIEEVFVDTELIEEVVEEEETTEK